MISRIVTTAALMAGTALACLPAQAQTGTTAQSTVESGGASPSGSVGTTSNTPRDNSSPGSTTMGQTGGGTTNTPGATSPGTMGTGGTTGTGTTMGTGSSMGAGSTTTGTGTTMGAGSTTGTGTGMGTGTSMGAGTTASGSMDSSTSATGSATGSMNRAPRDQAQGHTRSHRTMGMRSGNMAERQMTDCLNNAAAQGQPLSSCKR